VNVLGEPGGAIADGLAEPALLAPQQQVGGAAAGVGGLLAGLAQPCGQRLAVDEQLHRPLLAAGERGERVRQLLAALAEHPAGAVLVGEDRAQPQRDHRLALEGAGDRGLVGARRALEPRHVVQVAPQRLLVELAQGHRAAQHGEAVRAHPAERAVAHGRTVRGGCGVVARHAVRPQCVAGRRGGLGRRCGGQRLLRRRSGRNRRRGLQRGCFPGLRLRGGAQQGRLELGDRLGLGARDQLGRAGGGPAGELIHGRPLRSGARAGPGARAAPGSRARAP